LLVIIITSWLKPSPLNPKLVKQEKIIIVLNKVLMVPVLNVTQMKIQFYQTVLVSYVVQSLLDVQNVLMELLLLIQLPVLHVK
jgi:hypothetical protein